ncbi:MAG: VCBS repeat-containing protein, partial [Planctomycetales bacterium]|nr:VCBS repeat-containing protein [Planctomycetales bacterium]
MKARRLHLQELESRQLLTADVLNETAISFAGPIRSGELPADDYYSGSTFADLDGDGDQDLVFGSSNRAGLQFAINHNGQFVRSESTVRLSEKIQIVTSADFNADGIADFAAAGTTSIFILLGQSEDPFALTQTQRISTAATSLAVGDVDNDGAVDLVVGNSRISVFNGNNDGTFQAAIQYGESANAWLVALGDVDADGDMDLAAADESSVRIFANDGGIFETEADQITDATFARMIEFHDINADGQLDLFVGHQIHEETLLAIYPGQGNGTFDHEASHYETLGVPSEVHLADIDNNGSLDMVIGHHSTFHHPVNGNGPGGVSVLLANDRNTFEPAIRLNTPEPQRLLLSDTNQDGRLDISAVQQDAVNTLRMQDDALFAADVTRFSVGNSWSYSDAGDLNGDGRMDVVIATGEYESQRTVIEILLSTESGEFINLSDTQTGIVNGVFIRDFAGSGQATLAMMATGSQRSKIVHWSVGADNKLGDATTTRLSTIWNFHSPQDVDSDGAIDLVGVRSDSQTLLSLQWNLDGTFLSHKTIGTFAGYQEPASVDFNGDGLLDFVLTGDRVDVAISTANGSYETQRLSNLQYANAATGDVNGDGHADIV